MRKILAISISILFFASCGAGKLTRNDLSKLPSRNFVLTEVSVKSSSSKNILSDGLGVEEDAFKKIVQKSLPVKNLSKSISEQLKISIETNQFENSLNKNENPEWVINKENSNQVKIIYYLREVKVSGFTFAHETGLTLGTQIIIISADGKTKDMYFSSPPGKGQCYTPINFAKKRQVPVTDVVKAIIKEDLKNLPVRLNDELSRGI